MPGQATITIRDRQWQVSIADTPWELTQGLGGISELPAGTGMLFDLGSEQIVHVTTVPMLFPLDIAFYSEGMVITEVYRNIDPGYIVTSTLPARYFLEVNAGEFEGIGSGDRALVELLPLEGMAVTTPDWMSSMISLMGIVVIGMFAVVIVQDLVKGMLRQAEEGPALLPQTKPEVRFKPGEIVHYKGERVRVQEHAGDRVSIWIPSRQEEVWVEPEKLERVERQSRASEILKGLSGKGDGYRAYVRYPRDKTAFVTIGAIIGGHYSWNPAGFTVWVDAWERNPEWPPDSVLAIKELRRPRSFEATEEGVKAALDYIDREFPTFTETKWVSKSIPLYVAYELGIVGKEAVPMVLPNRDEVMEYRVEKNEPYDTWAVVELWPGGTIRSPFKSKDEAINREEEIGQHYGWKLRRVEFSQTDVDLLNPQRFPKRTEALNKLKGHDVIYVHDDGDLTVRSRGKLYVVTTEGQVFEQKEYLAQTMRNSSELKPTGTCYADAWRFLVKEEEGELIHGTVFSSGRRMGHAWVETPTGYVWEPETGRYFTLSGFKHAFAPVVEDRYTAEEAAIMAARTKNLGPWAEKERQQYLKEKSPATIHEYPQQQRKDELEYLADSPEYLSQTIDAIGYRDRLDDTFKDAIARAKGLR